MNPEEQALVNFHDFYEDRVRLRVLQEANLLMGKRQFWDLPDIHPRLRRWIRQYQQQIWLWECRLHVIFWTSRIDKAWREVFTDSKFRRYTEVKWKRYFLVPRPLPSQQIRHGFDLSTYVRSRTESIGNDQFIDYLEQLPPTARIPYLEEPFGYCVEIRGSYNRIRQKLDDLANAADRYCEDATADRDPMWEQTFAKEWKELSENGKAIWKRWIQCQKFHNTLRIRYELGDVKSVKAFKSTQHVLRLAESPETIRQETRGQMAEDDSTNGTEVAINPASNKASHPTSESQSKATGNVPANVPERKPLEDRNGSTMQNGNDTSSSTDAALNGFHEPKTTGNIQNTNSKLNSTQGTVARKDNEHNPSPPPILKKTVVKQKLSNSPETIEAPEEDAKAIRTEMKDSKAPPRNPTSPAE